MSTLQTTSVRGHFLTSTKKEGNDRERDIHGTKPWKERTPQDEEGYKILFLFSLFFPFFLDRILLSA
jgi:hypothetical protein